MTAREERILDKVRTSLGADRLAGAIVYLDPTVTRAGARTEVGDVSISVPWDAHIAFVDLEPRANWGHDCCYLAVGEADEQLTVIRAQMPPFLKAGPSRFRLLWRGPGAPEWAVAGDSR
jgi:hypothetical protein